MNRAIIEAIVQKRYITQKMAEYADFGDPDKADRLWGMVDGLFWVIGLLDENTKDMEIERELVGLTNKIYYNGKKNRKESE